MTQLILNIETPSLEKKIRNMLKDIIGVHISSCATNDDIDKTDKFISRFAGKWHGSESAEEILAAIDENSTFKSPVNFD